MCGIEIAAEEHHLALPVIGLKPGKGTAFEDSIPDFTLFDKALTNKPLAHAVLDLSGELVSRIETLKGR